MLTINLRSIFAQKGIQDPNKFLVKNGFTYHTASRLLNNEIQTISFRNLEDLCLALNCTINDLFAWTPPGNNPNLQNHPLQQLIPKPTNTNLAQELINMPFHKLKEIQNFIDKLE